MQKFQTPTIANSLHSISTLQAKNLRPAIDFLRKAAFGSKSSNRLILDKLKETIVETGNAGYATPPSSAALKLNVPDGLKPGEEEKYRRLLSAATIEQAAIETVLSIVGPAELLDAEFEWFKLIDKSGMIDRLGKWPVHIKTMNKRAIDAAKKFKEKHGNARIDKIKLFGLGGSAAPHDITRDIIANSRKTSLEIEVVRGDTPNPDFIDKHTLVVFCSFSGDTEETINCFKIIGKKTGLIAAIAQGGELEKIAGSLDLPFIKIPDDKRDPAYVMQPRESVCLQSVAALSFLSRIGLLGGSGGTLSPRSFDFEKLSGLIVSWRKRFGPSVEFENNPAKQLAFFMLYGFNYTNDKSLASFDIRDKKIPYVIGDYNLRALVHEVSTQFRERSKVVVIEGTAPEDLHNSVEAIRATLESSIASLDKNPYVYLFLDSLDSEQRIGFRLEKTREFVLQNKGVYTVLNAEGETAMERAFFLTYFNAHMTTYAAAINGFDPLPVPTMSWIKKIMSGFPRNCKEEKEYAGKKRKTLELFD